MPVHLLHGDGFLVPKRLAEVIAEAGASDVLESNRHRLVGSQVKPGELLSMCNALPFMDDYRLVIVEGLLGTTESQGRGRRRGSAVSLSLRPVRGCTYGDGLMRVYL